MQHHENFSSIDLIIGPMYAGKTTELIRRLNTLKSTGLKCVYVNSDKDNRSVEDFSTHNKTITNINGIDSILIKESLIEILEYYDSYDVFGIDEAQLIPDLKSTCLILSEKYHKKIIIAGLNADSDRNHFGEIHEMLPICEDISKLHSYCHNCSINSKITPAHFTGCTINKIDKILIGGTESYLALCRSCYVELQSRVSDQEISYDILNSSGSSCESDKNSEEKELLL